MGSNRGAEVMISGVEDAECSETTVEIKIKTLDSQTYTLRVNKRHACESVFLVDVYDLYVTRTSKIGVPELKEKIETVTGVLSAQQRLICRGKVLKDDQLLSAYHVEDGHTLHLVVRQPFHASSASTMSSIASDSLLDNAATDSASRSDNNRASQLSHSVVLGTFNIGDHGDGGIPDLNRIVSAVLSSIGMTSSEGTNLGEPGQERLHRELGASNMTDPGRLEPDQPHTSASRIQTAASLSPLQPPVIPDSLTTLSQYLSHLRNEFTVNARGWSSNARVADMLGSERREYSATLPSASGPSGLPTPAALAEIMLSTRRMLIEQAGEYLSQTARQLEDQVNVTLPSVRSSTQTSALGTGVLLQNLGALLLELGRTTMTLRMGQTPSEASVNAGPAVFISASGPNPIMVQPLPFQPGIGFGAIPMGSGTHGSGFFPRNIDIRIRTGSSMNRTSANRDNQADVQQIPGGTESSRSSDGMSIVHQADSGVPSFTRDSGVRMVPFRTVVAAVPTTVNRPSSDSSGSSIGLLYPLLARVQRVTSGQLNITRDSQATGERHPNVPETDQQHMHGSVQQQNVVLGSEANVMGGHSESADFSLPANIVPDMSPSNTALPHQQQGSVLNMNSRWPEQSGSNNNNTQSSCGTPNGHSAPQISSSSGQLHSTDSPGEQLYANDQLLPSNSVTEQGGPAVSADRQDAVPRLGINEGIFLSRLVRQIMPYISQVTDTETDGVSEEGADTTEHQGSLNLPEDNESDVGTSHRRCNSSPPSPSTKRQKRE